jgi:hypothetical protein
MIDLNNADVAAAMNCWRAIDDAPRDGSAFLAYGRHTERSAKRRDVQQGVQAGDHWWAIILWDVWRRHLIQLDHPGLQWVFSKDGSPVWSTPLRWMPLTVPFIEEPWPSGDDDG